MSSAQNQSPQPKRSASSSPIPPDKQAGLSSESAASAETSPDLHLDSPTPMISPVSSTPVEVMSPTTPASGDSIEPIDDLPSQSSNLRHHPIPPASEPMQYRAIGLIRGQYEASGEQFTRGNLRAEDGTLIDAVLLGRVMSLVKKHLNLEQSHLWVVYPRTREKNNDLHMQIVGVWEPEKLAKDRSEADELSEATTPPEGESKALELEDGYFSIRGEVLFYSEDEKRLIVKIQQSPRSGSDQGKAFKLNIEGVLPGNKSVGYFWDLQVQRQDNLLVVREATVIGLVPPKKRKPGEAPDRRRSGQGAPRRGGMRPPARMGGDRPSVAPPAPRREPISKPVKRPKDGSV